MLETMGKMVFKMMASVEVSEDMTAGGGSQKGDTADRRAVREGPGPCRLQH